MVLCPYWANIQGWISTGFTSSAQRNHTTPHSSMMQSCKGVSMFSPSLLPLDWRQSAVLQMVELFNRHCQYCAMRQLLSVPVTAYFENCLSFLVHPCISILSLSFKCSGFIHITFVSGMEVSICWAVCILQTAGLLQEWKVMTSHLNILPVMTIGIVTEQASLGSTA